MHLSQAIRALRGTRTQARFAWELGVSIQTVNRWERRANGITLANLRLLVDQHGLDPSFLRDDATTRGDAA